MRTLPLTNRGLHLPTIVTLGLLTVLVALLASASAVSAQGSAPDTPDKPVGTAVFVGGVDLEWNDVPGADSYDVQLFRNGQWTDLPADGVEIAFYGAGAVISGLDPTATLWFQVRARNAHGSSDWSPFGQMPSTEQFEKGRQPKPENLPASGAPDITGTAQVGQTLTAGTTGIEDENGLDRVQFRFQWVSNDGNSDADITGATDSNYTLVAADEGNTIKVRVSFTDRGGYSESLTSIATASVISAGEGATGQGSVQNTPATGAPTVSGTAQVGEALTADTSGIADADGLTNVSYSYQWIRNDGTSDTDITGATSSSYTLVANDEGNTIKVRVSFTDDEDNDETLTSAATSSVAAKPNSAATGAPTITGTAQVGETLTASTSGISDTDGLTNVSYSYQWLADDTETAGATSSTYTLQASDNGKAIKVRVTFTDDEGNGESLTSEVTATVEAAPNNPATGAPSISGTAEVGEPLTADVSGIADDDGLSGSTFSYQWISNDGTTDTDITGATSSSYTLVAADEGTTIKVKVTFTDDAGFDETLTSTATETVSFAVQQQRANSPATGAPTITGTTAVGETLTADTAGIADDDGLSGATFSYQWISNDGNADTDITGATDSSYTLVAADESKTIKVKVTFTDDADNDESLTSTATSSVAARPNSPATGSPTITGTAQVGETLTADTSGIDGLTSVSYYEWIFDRTGLTWIIASPWSTYTLVAADEGTTVKVRVSFTDEAGHLKTLTSTATETVSFAVQQQRANSPATGAPTITGTAQVGETLTADTAGIAAADGLSNVSYSYQWVSNDGTSDTDITGATDSTYTLVAADEGKTIRVRVNFTNDAGYGETLTSAVTGAVAAQANSVLMSYITVVVTEDTSDPNNVVTNFTVTWSDGGDCSTNYNAYLYIDSEPTIHLGSATFDSVQIAKGLAGLQGTVGPYGIPHTLTSVTVSLFCGTDESGRFVSNVSIPPDVSTLRPKRGTYSSEPTLSALGVSHGTLTPTFNSYISSYTVPDVANDVMRLTITATPKTGYTVDFFEASDKLYAFGFLVYFGGPLGLSADCDPKYSDNYGPMPELTDADPNTPGFQVDLYDGGNYVMVRVYPTDLCDLGENYFLGITRAEGSVSLVRPNRPATGWPSISGLVHHERKYRAFIGRTLTAGVSDIYDRDGLDNATFSYQWLADDADITGETSSSYTVAATDLGKSIDVRVSFTDDRGTEETVTLWSPLIVRMPNEDPKGSPIVRGTLEVGQTLTADVSGISDPNGMTNATFSYEWTNLHGPVRDGKEYILVSEDVGRRLRVWVTYTDDAGYEERVNGDTLGVVAPRPNSPATGTPAITGTAQVGETLTADTASITDADGLTNASYSYQWISNDGSSDTDITGATDSTYTLVAADEGRTIKVKVTFTDDAGFDETLTSTATETVSFAVQQQRANSPATGAPTITGTAQVGETLTADTAGIADADGLSGATFSYQWVSNDGTSDIDITGATDSSYTLVAADEVKTIKVRVSFTDDSDNEETLTSEATAAVTAAEPDEPPARPQGLTGTVAHDAVSLTWDDPGDATITGYQILRRDRALHDSGDFQLHVNDTGSAAAAYIDRDVSPEGSYVYRIKARNAAGLSGQSSYFRADTPSAPAQNSPATGEPTIGGTARVGETLTADVSGIADADGLSGASFSYQWISNDGNADTDIVGATGSTYTLTTSDEGKAIKVRVSFTDDVGFGETLSSAATAAVAAQNSPAIKGVVRVGETLTVDTSGIADGLSGVTFSYQWVSNDGTTDTDIVGATGSTYTLTANDEGKTIKVRVTFTVTIAATETVEAYVTVVVADDLSDPGNPSTSLTITFSPVAACTRGEYNAYISNWLDDFKGIAPRHLGSAATDATQITSTISNLQGEGLVFDVEVFCGTDSGLLVSWAKIPHDNGPSSTESNRRLVPGTYSSEPSLTSLTVSPGTLTPTFHSHTTHYTAPDLTNTDNRVTLMTTAKTGFNIIYGKASTIYTHCPWASGTCTITFKDSSGNAVDPLTDADTDTPGFQVDIAVGENKILMYLYEGAVGTGNNDTYSLTVTRL